MKKFFTLYSLLIFSITFLFLSIIQVVPERAMLLLERFVPHLGWIEVFLFSGVAVFLADKLNNPLTSTKWRKISWFSFSIFFFAQLLLGVIGIEECLMTGKLHFPIPAMILGGPLYRGELTFMVFLFSATVILSGPTWCSQLCYFGALDFVSSGKRSKKFTWKYMKPFKYTNLILFVFATLILRLLGFSTIYAIVFASSFGVIGLLIILIFSYKTKKMIHCTYFCPIGTLVSLIKKINPFRVKIAPTCNQCMKCTITCKYGALEKAHIQQLEPGTTCTYCGDCLSSCHADAIHYKLFKLKPETARKIYVAVTVIIFSVFFAVARI